MSAGNRPERPQENYSGVTTSPESREPASEALSGQKRRFPAMWWSPSDGQWFADVPGEGLMAYGAVGSREDSLPKDSQRLVPVGPLLALVAEWQAIGIEYDAMANADMSSLYAHHARRLRALLGPPEFPLDLLDEHDLRVEYYAAPGQPVYEGPVAVRITHDPSGITVSAESERTQLQNKVRAIRELTKRVHEHQAGTP